MADVPYGRNPESPHQCDVCAAFIYDDQVAHAGTCEEIRRLRARVAELEKNAHEPFDFTELVRRIEHLERGA